MGGDNIQRIADTVVDPNAAALFDRLSQENDTQLVREVMTTLTERERAILDLRFGLADGTQRALEEVGEHFGLTRERIRQIQEQALRKLRAKMEERDCPLVDEPTTLVVTA
jgi:RNA polymerase primary sigma factor